MVPQDWQHPKSDDGHYIPLLGGSYSESLKRYRRGERMWAKGLREDFSRENGWVPRVGKEVSETYEEWSGRVPHEEDYMPDFDEDERTHFQMYESTSEGTPISPVFATAEELAHWLADNNASAFADMTATYEQWLATIRAGSSCSCVVSGGVLQSGVAASL